MEELIMGTNEYGKGMSNGGKNGNGNGNTYLTPSQAAKILSVSLSTLKKFIYSGRIRTLKTPGGHHRILKKDLYSLSGGTGSDTNDILKDRTLNAIARAFINTLEKRQRFSIGHSTSVADLSADIARKLKFSPQQIELVYVSALLHDIGMLSISSSILNKEAPLSDAEYQIVKTHPLLGEDFVISIRQFTDYGRSIRQHHERYDGTGYPDRLSKDEICPEAKIISIAEAYDAMIAENSYREPMSEKEARAEIKKNAGIQFDPEVAKAFLAD